MKRLLLAALLLAARLDAGEQYIPAAAHAAGANNTFFKTDVRIVNLGSTSATFELSWLAANSDNSAAAPKALTIAPRASRQLDDIVLSFFNLDAAGGAIRIASANEFAATSRTYTTSSAGCPGTFGQFIPALGAADATARAVIPNVRLSVDGTTGFRSNVGIMNPSRDAVAATLRLRSGTGALLGSAAVNILPLGQTQSSVAALFAAPVTDDNAFVEIEAPKPLLSYVSVVDNRSGDPVFIAGIPDPGTNQSTPPLVTARQWVFEPALIETAVGRETTIRVRATDVDHGIGLSGVGPYTCSSEQGTICVLRPGEDVTITFTPRTAGTFAFYCTRFCGASGTGESHETMRGTIIVR